MGYPVEIAAPGPVKRMTFTGITTTGSVVVPGVAGKKLVIMAAAMNPSNSTAGSIFIKSGSTSGAVIYPDLFSTTALPQVLQFNPLGWGETVVGEGIFVVVSTGTTGRGLIVYTEV